MDTVGNSEIEYLRLSSFFHVSDESDEGVHTQFINVHSMCQCYTLIHNWAIYCLNNQTNKHRKWTQESEHKRAEEKEKKEREKNVPIIIIIRRSMCVRYAAKVTVNIYT